MPVGHITRLEAKLGFGWLVDEAGMDWFFVADAVSGTGMERLRVNGRVVFTPEWTPKGPRASAIRVESLRQVE